MFRCKVYSYKKGTTKVNEKYSYLPQAYNCSVSHICNVYTDRNFCVQCELVPHESNYFEENV